MYSQPLTRVGLHRKWEAMIHGTDKKTRKTPSGRAVKMHLPWRLSFDAFATDIGMPPDDGQAYWLCRRDPDGDYVPGNVYWARAIDRKRAGKGTSLDEQQVRDILYLVYDQEIHPREVARTYRIGIESVRSIVRGRRWRLPDYDYARPLPDNYRSRPPITDDEVLEILDRVHVRRQLLTEVSRTMDVSRQYVADIALGNTRRVKGYPYPDPTAPMVIGAQMTDAQVRGLLWDLHYKGMGIETAAEKYNRTPATIRAMGSGKLRKLKGYEYPTAGTVREPVKEPPKRQRRRGARGVPALVLGLLTGGPATWEDLAVDAVAAMPPPAEGRRDTRRQQVARAVKTLIGAGLVVETDGVIRAVDEMC